MSGDGTEVKKNIKNLDNWIRLLFMVLFIVFFKIAAIVLFVVVLFQLLSTLLTGSRNKRLLDLGAQLATYMFQILNYLTYNSDDKPFPFADWPSTEGTSDIGGTSGGGGAEEAGDGPGAEGEGEG